jgi:hypothetical protein
MNIDEAQFRTRFVEVLCEVLDAPECTDSAELQQMDLLSDLRFDREGLIDAFQEFSERYDERLDIGPLERLTLPSSIPMLVRLFRWERIIWPKACGTTLGALLGSIYAATVQSRP